MESRDTKRELILRTPPHAPRIQRTTSCDYDKNLFSPNLHYGAKSIRSHTTPNVPILHQPPHSNCSTASRCDERSLFPRRFVIFQIRFPYIAMQNHIPLSVDCPLLCGGPGLRSWVYCIICDDYCEVLTAFSPFSFFSSFSFTHWVSIGSKTDGQQEKGQKIGNEKREMRRGKREKEKKRNEGGQVHNTQLKSKTRKNGPQAQTNSMLLNPGYYRRGA